MLDGWMRGLRCYESCSHTVWSSLCGCGRVRSCEREISSEDTQFTHDLTRRYVWRKQGSVPIRSMQEAHQLLKKQEVGIDFLPGTARSQLPIDSETRMTREKRPVPSCSAAALHPA
ncbi:hypothetical protein ISCGN_032465 [Ixodes scapularis]